MKTLPDKIVDCCITSPPYYGLRDYGTGRWVGGDPKCPHRRLSKFSEKTITGHHQKELAGNVGDAIYKNVCPLCGAVREDKQIGLEETPEEYVSKLTAVFHEVKRVLKDNGTLWLNIGDSYAGSGNGRNADGTANVKEGSKNASSMGTVEGHIFKRGDGEAKPKDLIGIPWMLAFSLRNDGWYLRQDIIWAKPNPMPESVKDRCTKSHEYVFLLAKSREYYFDHEAIQEEAIGSDRPRIFGANNQTGTGRNDIGRIFTPNHKNLQYDGQTPNTMHERRAEGFADIQYSVRNKRDVWSIPVMPVREAHFATFPEKLVEPCILAGCPPEGIVLDPFFGSGTTGRVATRLNRHYIGCKLNPKYIEISERRTNNIQLSFVGMI